MKNNREKLLALFTESDGAYLSGQEIADSLGCSRTAVWKQMEALRKEGFEIEAVRNRGYRLSATAEQYTKDALLLGLETKFIGQHIEIHESVSSTQIIAHQQIDTSPEGTVIVADEQTAGKGRLLRPWNSKKGEGIWMSVILKPQIPIQKVPQFTFIASLAITEAIENITKLEPRIKWPNDIYIGKRKICGVLTEMQAEAETIHAVIIGMGINVNQQVFPEEIKDKASSLKLELGESISRKVLLQEILASLEKYYELFLDKGFAPIKLLWETKAIPFGEKLTASTTKGKIYGKVQGISDEGVLLLQDNLGEVHSIYSADILLDNEK
ncbi:biotin--[acetyl-CoA-carboxylase] ligase [Listeria welshimeri]|nr:biotin--[acetyl-CoA-carboxylase] ligase [Listeria welshimeri]